MKIRHSFEASTEIVQLREKSEIELILGLERTEAETKQLNKNWVPLANTALLFTRRTHI